MDSLEELKSKIDKFNKDRDWDQFHTPENLAKSIVLEAAELLECFQWDNKNYDLNAVKEELADVFNYCIQMSIVLDLDIKKIVEEKMAKNAKKYPVSKAKGSSKKYTELAKEPAVVKAEEKKPAKKTKTIKENVEKAFAPIKDELEKPMKAVRAKKDEGLDEKAEKTGNGFSAYVSDFDKKFFFDLSGKTIYRNDVKYKDYTKKKLIDTMIDYYNNMDVINYALSEEELLFLKVNKSRVVNADNAAYRYLKELMLFTEHSNKLAVTTELVPALGKALTDYKNRKAEIEAKKENAYLLVGIMRVFGALSNTEINRILSKYTNDEIGNFYELPFALRHIEYKDEYGVSYFALRNLGLDAVSLIESHPENLKCSYSKKELIGIGKAYFNIHGSLYRSIAKNAKAVALIKKIDKEELIRSAGRGEELKVYIMDFYSNKDMTEKDRAMAYDLVKSLPKYTEN